MSNPVAEDLVIKKLGPCRIDSPFASILSMRTAGDHYVEDGDVVLYDDTLSNVVKRGVPIGELPGFEPAGPRLKIFFDPSKTRAGIVTCGGLCPGLNNVIRGLTLELVRYGVKKVYGFRNGFAGFIAKYGHEAMELTPQVVENIHEMGGTILASSRGKQDAVEIVDCLENMGIKILFVIGGDGSMRGALDISREVESRNLKISIIGIPKTIDNDVMCTDLSFGFQTAFSAAVDAIRSAHVEATGAPNGIGLVKLMGRHSGFIAAYSSLAMNDANFVLIPEVPFKLEGEGGFLKRLEERMRKRGHAVIVVAEGAGQDLFNGQGHSETDASGNTRLKDIGLLLRERINAHFKAIGVDANLKYIDPSYAIRSVPANPIDSVYCCRLAHNAVHAAMSGRTEMLISRRRFRFIHVPMKLAISQRYQIDRHGDLWMTVLESTGQPWEFH